MAWKRGRSSGMAPLRRTAAAGVGLVAAIALIPGGASGGPHVAGAGGCPVFPATSQWNLRVDKLPLDPRSGAIVSAIGIDAGAHADFGSGLYDGAPIGIPYRTVSPK